jgi:hypothetical protein
MKEKPNQGHCETKGVNCLVVTLATQLESYIDTFLEEARVSYEEASSNYTEDAQNTQKEIDELSISRNCQNCPHNSKQKSLK